ncbi:kremen protein 1 isoform X2 [Ascaphus truei]
MPGNLGCFKDHGNPPPLTGISETSNKQTIQSCITMCRQQRFKTAGLESGFACFCGNNGDYRKHGETPSTDCNSVCFGDHTQPCGGDGRIILFDTLIGACGGNYTMDSAVIYSPDFPDTYGTGKACYWTIHIPGASLLHFNFTFFDIKDARDMVELLDGYTKQVLVRFDGRNHPSHSFNISLDFVILYFFSDRVNQAQGFAVVYQAFKERHVEKLKLHSNQSQTEHITQTTNLSINAARSSKILYVITTSPSRSTGHAPGWTVYALTALLILTVIAVLAKALLHLTMKSHRLASATSLDNCHRGSAGEIWSIFYKPSTSISIFPKKLKSQHDDRNPLVGE